MTYYTRMSNDIAPSTVSCLSGGYEGMFALFYSVNF